MLMVIIMNRVAAGLYIAKNGGGHPLLSLGASRSCAINPHGSASFLHLVGKCRILWQLNNAQSFLYFLLHIQAKEGL